MSSGRRDEDSRSAKEVESEIESESPRDGLLWCCAMGDIELWLTSGIRSRDETFTFLESQAPTVPAGWRRLNRWDNGEVGFGLCFVLF